MKPVLPSRSTEESKYMSENLTDPTKPEGLAESILERLADEWDQPRPAVLETVTPFSLHHAIDSVTPLMITPEEVLTRQCLLLLGNRRWGYARAEREKLELLLNHQGMSLLPAHFLQIFADILEGKSERAAAKLNEILPEEGEGTAHPDFYLLYAMLTLVYDGVKPWNPEVQSYNAASWEHTFLARALASASFESDNVAITELGHLADTLIKTPGIKRFVAIWIRALQGNKLIYRGEYAWAERVLTYAKDRAEAIMSYHQPLLDAIDRDLAIAQEGVAHLSYH